MNTTETTLATQQPEPVTMFHLDPVEGGAFDLTLTTWTERGYEQGTFRLDPRIAAAFNAAVSREMADVPPPPPITWDDLMRIGREVGCMNPHLGDGSPLQSIAAGHGDATLAAAHAQARGDHAN
ncbi:hypothetical protein OIU91_06200 [Streptomyces sp. NBC_01456]|uniref:hypothetical protein n=1 Tax=Streptomyces sp. NBC_01456 TaxID=2975868 RepID=UPI002E2EC46B|nr:hypothetical protein [Streptomyces sp. NBC_01456]